MGAAGFRKAALIQSELHLMNAKRAWKRHLGHAQKQEIKSDDDDHSLGLLLLATASSLLVLLILKAILAANTMQYCVAWSCQNSKSCAAVASQKPRHMPHAGSGYTRLVSTSTSLSGECSHTRLIRCMATMRCASCWSIDLV